MAIRIGQQVDLDQAPLLGLVFEPSPTPPVDPVDGQPWHDTTTDRLKVRLAGQWHTVSHVGESAPPAAHTHTSAEITDLASTLSATIATAIEAHRADTSDVHGIPDTSILETIQGAQAKVDAAIAALTDGAPTALDTLNEIAAALAEDQSALDAILLALDGKADSSSLAPVATTGSYSSLTGTPALAPVATTGAYSDLTGTPEPFDPAPLQTQVTDLDGRVDVLEAEAPVPGPEGPSAYDVAVANGFVGTESEWLASLEGEPGAPGDPGDPGADGDSAYETWLALGNVGTEADFLASLKGDPGDPGDPGADGRGIASVTLTDGDGTPGTTDTYTITYTDATTSTFTVYNGADGAGGTGGGVAEGTYALQESGVTVAGGNSSRTHISSGNYSGTYSTPTFLKGVLLSRLTVDVGGAGDYAFSLDGEVIATLAATAGGVQDMTLTQPGLLVSPGSHTVQLERVSGPAPTTYRNAATSDALISAPLNGGIIGTSGSYAVPFSVAGERVDWVEVPLGGGGSVATLDSLTDVDTTTVAPATGNALVFDGTKWAPGEVAAAQDSIPTYLEGAIPAGAIPPYLVLDPSTTPVTLTYEDGV